MAGVTVKNIHPLAGYVVVEPQEAQKQTSSGIFLAASNEEKPQIGTVVSISESYTTESGTVIKCPVKVGETVLYKKWGGSEVKVGEKELQVLKYDDLIATMK